MLFSRLFSLIMTKKEKSLAHEKYLEQLYDGVRTVNSGATSREKGDVRIRQAHTLIEAKCTGGPGEPYKSSRILKLMEQIADEAWQVGLEPALALRYFNPESSLASPDGWVDFSLRLAQDDSVREANRCVCP
jgi:hypothetical protein